MDYVGSMDKKHDWMSAAYDQLSMINCEIHYIENRFQPSTILYKIIS